MEESSLKQMADRVEALLSGFDAVSSARTARENAEALVQTIVGLYGAGLERALTIVYETAGDRADEIFAHLCADKFVESLLCLHGLHPIAVEDRVQQALDAVRPYLKSHEGGVEVTGVEDGVVTLRLQGSCDGCPSSSATVKLAVERSILERVPEIREVRAENVTEAPPRPGGSLSIESDWIALDSLHELAAGRAAARDVSGTGVVFFRFDESVYAYRNRCPNCAAALDGGALAQPLLTCAVCGHAYDMVRAGRPHDGTGTFCEPFPVVRENGRLRIALPLGV